MLDALLAYLIQLRAFCVARHRLSAPVAKNTIARIGPVEIDVQKSGKPEKGSLQWRGMHRECRSSSGGTEKSGVTRRAQRRRASVAGMLFYEVLCVLFAV